MFKTKALLLVWLFACVLLPGLLLGCATPMLQDVGAVVVAPRPQIPPVPKVVQQTEPRPMGFYQSSLLNFFSARPQTPTR